MSFTDFITDHGRRINKESFIHLVQIAQADGKVDEKEMNLLHRFGRRFSLTDPEVDAIIKAESSHLYAPPVELEKRFGHLYNAVQIMMADGNISEEEKKIFRRLAIAASFSDEAIPLLLDLLTKGIKEGADEEDLLTIYRKASRNGRNI